MTDDDEAKPTKMSPSKGSPLSMDKSRIRAQTSAMSPTLKLGSPTTVPSLFVTTESTEPVTNLSRTPTSNSLTEEERLAKALPPQKRQLLVNVIRAENLIVGDIVSSDPFVKVTVINDSNNKSLTKKTGVHPKTLNPIFDESFLFTLSDTQHMNYTLKLEVFDYDKVTSNDPLGDKTMVLKNLNLKINQTQRHRLVLENVQRGTLTVEVTLLHTKSSNKSKAFMLWGNMDTEIKQKLELEPAMGQVPEWLNGSLFRQIPGRFTIGKSELQHWFDGPSMVHAFYLKDGIVEYQCRYLETDYMEEAKKAGELTQITFATKPYGEHLMVNKSTDHILQNDPCSAAFDGMKVESEGFDEKLVYDNRNMLYGYANQANVSFDILGDKIIAITDTPYSIQFDPDTLETVKSPFQWDDKVSAKGDVVQCAHPQFDPETGCSYNVLVRVSLGYNYKITRYIGDKREVLATVSAGLKPNYLHSFCMTKNYIILPLHPFVFTTVPLMLRRPILDAFEWNGNESAEFVVIDKHTGKERRRFKTSAFFVMHTANSYEDDNGDIVLDMITYPNWHIFTALLLDTLRYYPEQFVETVQTTRLSRFTLPMSTKHNQNAQVTRQDITNFGFEFPKYNNLYNGKKYKYCYGSGLKYNSSDFVDCIHKVDVDSGEVVTWYQEGVYPGEPIFCQRPNSTGEEDDGVLLVVALEKFKEKSALFIIDAKTMETTAVLPTPIALNASIHGVYKENNL
jgi:beta,beta-carotene 9',10'-dioxygenase